MLKRQKIHDKNDFFLGLNDRPEKGVYFGRLGGYSEEIDGFIRNYYKAARTCGVIIEGNIPNPNESQLSYYSEMMGMDFQLDPGFIAFSLKRWLPRMNDIQRRRLTEAMSASLERLKNAGKDENILKNAYIKYMCWLYYKFERVAAYLGENTVPKILYEGDVTKYELLLLEILSRAGCDILLLQYHGDANYGKYDEKSEISENLVLPGMTAFPGDFSLKKLREEERRAEKREQLYGEPPALFNCTNAWIQGKGLSDLCQSTGTRGEDPHLFYNCFYRIRGAADKLTYVEELYRFGQELAAAGRKTVIINGVIPPPGVEEIAGISRRNYEDMEQLLTGLCANLRFASNPQLHRLMRKAFLDVMLGESEKQGMNLNRLMNKGVYLLCWLKRYEAKLFSGFSGNKNSEISCLIHMGECRNDNEALFLRMLARLPVDVLILCPNLNQTCCLEDELLYELNYPDSVNLTEFPESGTEVRMGTVAYHAERELDTLLYQDSGLYRDRQYQKANTIHLQTMYEEIWILWEQELKYRPGFSTENGTVTIPVICSKVSGVKDGNVQAYWKSVRTLVTEDTFVVKKAPFIQPGAPNPMKQYAVGFFRNGKLQKKQIRQHRSYPYGVLREEIQEYMLEKLQQLIDQKLIKGTFRTGTEYAIIATVLNLPPEIVRMIQKFDFTKKNPKMLYINTEATPISLEDTILTAFLDLIGFDIVFFVPTGYQTVEKYFDRCVMEEHQAGDYLYDLPVPDLRPGVKQKTWRDIFFRRGT